MKRLDPRKQSGDSTRDSGEIRGSRQSWVRWIAVAAGCGALTIAITWPLAGQLANGLPLGTEQVATVPLFNLWTLNWNVERLESFYRGYWEAPIFHPSTGTFAFSEPQPLTGLLAAPLFWITDSALVAYNLILLLALATNGFLTAVLLRGIGLGWIAASTGGAFVLLLPFVHQELGVLQLVLLAGVLGLAWRLWRFGETPSLRNGLLLGFTLTLAYGLSAQIAAFAVLAFAPAALWLWWGKLRQPRTWVTLAAAGLLFLTLASPILLGQFKATANENLERSVETVRKQSAKPDHYLKSPWHQIVPTPGIETAERPSQRAFWPGTLKFLLALGGLIFGLSQTVWRRFTLAVLLICATSLLLSFGAHLQIGSISPAEILRSLPGFSQVRSFFRFALFAQLALAILAALGIEGLFRRTLPRVMQPLIIALALLAIFEMPPERTQIQPLPPLGIDLPWLSWIVESTEPDDVLAFLPFPEGRGVNDYLGTTQWMYWQMRHGRPMVNGYSGFFPQSFRELKKEMLDFPSQEALRALKQAGARYCIIHRTFINQSKPPEAGPLSLVPVFHDETHALAIFALEGS